MTGDLGPLDNQLSNAQLTLRDGRNDHLSRAVAEGRNLLRSLQARVRELESAQVAAYVGLHQCTVCRTYWLLWPGAAPPDGGDLWSLLDGQHQRPGACCDNAPMGEQIVHVRDLPLQQGRPQARPTGPLTQAQHGAASAALAWLRYMHGEDLNGTELADSPRYISRYKLAEVIAGLEPLVGAVLQVRAGLPAKPDAQRHEQSPGLFGLGIGTSTSGPVTCEWCSTVHNQGIDPEGNGPDGDWVGTAAFGSLQVCECCYSEVESAVLACIDDILAWYGRILARRRERDQSRADALRAIVGPVCTCSAPGRRGIGLAQTAGLPCPVHGGRP